MKMNEHAVQLIPIGTFLTDALYPYDVPRQGSVAGENHGVIRLFPGHHYEEALDGLDGFSHVWVLYCFDRNDSWRPKVQPPRHADHKIGVFATRSPYRPNPVGISAVRLDGVQGLDVWISGHDLLNNTPILDIKPYLPYADAFPEANRGWTAEHPDLDYSVEFEPLAAAQLDWLEEHGVPCMRQFVITQLGYDPLNSSRHRLMERSEKQAVLAYRTWRARFSVESRTVRVHEILSGYSVEDFQNGEDRYGDMDIHRAFQSLPLR